VVINEHLVRTFFGDRDPIGSQIHIPDDQTASLVGIKTKAYTIVGVVKDTKQPSLWDNDLFEIYFPSSEIAEIDPDSAPGISIALRTAVDPRSLAASVRRLVHGIDPELTVGKLTTMDDAIGLSLTQERLIATASASFSLFALLLASLGLYGALVYDVTQRTREIGVRMALGALPGSVVALILRQGLGLTAVGCAVGTIAALALVHLIAGHLYGISALDPLTFVVSVNVLFTVAFLACWLPARRATKIDPLIALRAE
jgi:putative ABC transport system permease protein